jgi:hypothetical protein
MIEVTLEDGKYQIRLSDVSRQEPYVFEALRHGEPWRDLIGDKLSLALVHEIVRLREANAVLEKRCRSLEEGARRVLEDLDDGPTPREDPRIHGAGVRKTWTCSDCNATQDEGVRCACGECP